MSEIENAEWLLASVKDKVDQALLTAPTIQEAKKLLGRTVEWEGEKDFNFPGLISCYSPEEFILCIDILDGIGEGAPLREDLDHEIAHYDSAIRNKCSSVLRVVIGLNGKTFENGYLQWESGWMKVFTTIHGLNQFSKTERDRILYEFHSAPENMSRQDRNMINKLMRPR